MEPGSCPYPAGWVPAQHGCADIGAYYGRTTVGTILRISSIHARIADPIRRTHGIALLRMFVYDPPRPANAQRMIRHTIGGWSSA